MKKDNYRDYVCEAYRYYAQCGCPDSEQLRQLRLNANEWQRANVSDLEAVYRVIQRLRSEPDGWLARQCLERVYLHPSQSAFSRGSISQRVALAARELSISESVVYRILRRLRLLLALERGLRIDDKYSQFSASGWYA